MKNLRTVWFIFFLWAIFFAFGQKTKTVEHFALTQEQALQKSLKTSDFCTKQGETFLNHFPEKQNLKSELASSKFSFVPNFKKEQELSADFGVSSEAVRVASMRAPAAGASAKMIAYSLFGNFAKNIVSFDIRDGQVENMKAIDNPFSATSMLVQGFRIYPSFASWIDNKLVGYFIATPNESASYLFAYGSYDPITLDLSIIGSGDVPSQIANGRGSAYDYSSQKNYVVGSDNILYWNSGADTIFTKVDTLRYDGKILSGMIRGVAGKDNGPLFLIVKNAVVHTDINLYKVNKNTAVAELVGPITASKILSAQYSSSAVFDNYTQKLYFEASGNSEDFICIDTATAKATVLGQYEEFGCLNRWYYTKNTPPAEASNFTVGIKPEHERTVTVGAQLPLLNFNGEALTLSKAYITRHNGIDFVYIDSISNPTAGSILSKEYTEIGEETGPFYYGLVLKTAEGVLGKHEYRQIYCYDIRLPYNNSFSTNDLKNYKKIGKQTDITLLETGGYTGDDDLCAEIKGAGTAYLNFLGIPLKKGAFYTIKVYAKPSIALGATAFRFYINNSFKSASVPNAGEWNLLTTSFLAEQSEQIGIGFGLNHASATCLIDSILIEETTPNTVPLYPSDIALKTAPMGEQAVLLSFKNPTLDMGDLPLAQLSGTLVYWANNASFTQGLGQDTIKNTIVGGVVTEAKINIPTAGNYYFRLQSYNINGNSPYYSSIPAPYFVGNDSTPASPVLDADRTEINKDGSVSFAWNSVKKGSKGGYLPGNTSYLVKYYSGDISKAVEVEVNDTVFNSLSLSLNLYTYTVHAKSQAGKLSSTPVTAHFITGAGENYVLAKNTNFPQGNTSTSTSVGFYTNTTANQSSYTQQLYAPSALRETYIDTLFFFVNPPSNTVKELIEISVGTKDTLFTSTTDWVKKTEMTTIFRDTLIFEPNERKIAIPTKGFYISGKKYISIGITKPRQTLLNTVPMYYANGTNQTLSAVSTLFDYDTSNNLPAGTRSANNALLTMSNAEGLSSVSGKITDKVFETAIEEASIRISGANLNVDITSNEEGNYAFNYLSEGEYIVKISAYGYVDSTFTLKVGKNKTYVHDIGLNSSNRIKISGKITDANALAIKDALITLTTSGKYFETSTDETGNFVYPTMFGSTEYSLKAEKENMQEYLFSFSVKDADTVLSPFKMKYKAFEISHLTAQIDASQNVNLSWPLPNSIEVLRWCGAHDTVKDLVSSGGRALKAAVKFEKADIKRLAGAKMLRAGFVSSDPTAVYHLSIYKGENAKTLIKKFPMKNELKKWSYANIDPKVDIDTTQELWLVLEIEANYQGYPLPGGNSAIVPGKGDLLYNASTSSWIRVSQADVTISGNWLISLDAETDKGIEAANGYKVYRGPASSQNLNDYTLLTQSNTKTPTYQDSDWKNQSFGQYAYAVVGDWYEQILSQTVFSNTLNKDMEFAVKVKVKTNGASAQNASIELFNESDKTYTYTATTDKNGEVDLPKVWRGTYGLHVSLAQHAPISMSGIKIDAGKTIETDVMEEYISNPSILSAVVSGNLVNLKWTMAQGNFKESFESYTDFAIDKVPNWIFSTPTKKGGIQDVKWANSDKEQSWIIFNPSKTQPALGASYKAIEGNKYISSFFSMTSPNNDYLIRRISKGGGKLSYWAFGSGYKSGSEEWYVKYSTTDSNWNSFDTIPMHGKVNKASGNIWKNYQLNIPQNAKYIAFQCVSNDQFFLSFDDIQYIVQAEGLPISYELYVDGTKVGTAKATASQADLENLSPGDHIVGLKALFASGGTSALITTKVTIRENSAVSNLKATVDKKNVVLSWEKAPGASPTAYKVYLGEEFKKETTALTHSFENLVNGNYDAFVTAMYGEIESEKTKVSFTVNFISVEDIDALKETKLYPNPSASGIFFLELSADCDVQVLQSDGKVIFTQRMQKGIQRLNLSNYAKSIYAVRISDKNSTKVLKAISK